MKVIQQLKTSFLAYGAIVFMMSSCGGADSSPVEKKQPSIENKTEQIQKKPNKGNFYQVNPGKSQVFWTAKKVTGEHTGTIEMKTGKVSYKDGIVDRAKFIIDMNSIVCTDIEDKDYNDKFIDHLFGDDFFSVKKYPIAMYEIGGSRKLKDGGLQAIGQLKIKGIEVKQEMLMKITPSGDHDLKMVGEMEIDRTLFNIRYGSGKFFDGLGDKMIDDTFMLKFELSLAGLR